jgi:hypothetical protein
MFEIQVEYLLRTALMKKSSFWDVGVDGRIILK